MIAVVIVLILFCVLYVLSTMCRSSHPGMEKLQNWIYAHRGYHGEGVPENSMEAFRRARSEGFGIELDVHLLADGNLAVIHDSSLKRTTGQDGVIEDLTALDLGKYTLEGTQQTIPLFSDVLTLCKGRVPLIVELKPERDNFAALTQAACKMLDAYEGVYCVESFDPRCIRWLRKYRPDIIRGQLSYNYPKKKEKLGIKLLKFLVKNQMLNFLLYPDFIAYQFQDRKRLGNFLSRKLWGVQGVSWTISSQRELKQSIHENWLPIFEGFIPD